MSDGPLSKTCKGCGETKLVETDYDTYHPRGKLAVRSRCKPCRANGRRYCLKSRYGITLEEFQHLAESQNYQCKICSRSEKLCVDHCHESGAIRGLLCDPCNRGIGIFQDSPERLSKAIEYLNEANS